MTPRGGKRLRIVVSAGPTREPLDAVRFLTNGSSGRMGFAVAEAARRAGHLVTLVAGPTHLPPPRGVRTIRVTTALQMRKAVLACFKKAHALVMTAAVSDYRPARPRRGKWKKGPARMSLPLVRNPDILAEAGRRKGRRICIGFAVETAGALRNAREKLRRKNLDAICVCSPAAFDRPWADYFILLPDVGKECHQRIKKGHLARRLLAFLDVRHDRTTQE